MAKRILLVDDEPLILKGLRFTLEQEGYDILTAADGEEALQVFFDQVKNTINRKMRLNAGRENEHDSHRNNQNQGRKETQQEGVR